MTAFLDANAERRPERREFAWGEGDDSVSMFEEVDPGRAAPAGRGQAVAGRASTPASGYVSGEPAYGGRGLPAADRLYSSLEARYDVPSQSFFGIGLGMVAPTIKDHAQPHIKDRYLPAMYRGDVVGCQLFSEPGAGPTWRACRPWPSATATSGSSRARRCGRPAPSTATSAR